MQKYVTAFLFSENGDKVAMIRKTKPKWQEGLLNAIGGKVEENEKFYDAMLREFREETGVDTQTYPNKVNWKFFHKITAPHAEIHCWTGTGDLSKLRSTTEEKVEIWNLMDIYNHKKNFYSNSWWLVFRAHDSLFGDDRSVTSSHYN